MHQVLLWHSVYAHSGQWAMQISLKTYKFSRGVSGICSSLRVATSTGIFFRTAMHNLSFISHYKVALKKEQFIDTSYKVVVHWLDFWH